MPEWPLHQFDLHAGWELLAVFSSELLAYAVIMNVQSGYRHLVVAPLHLGIGAPRQKFGVTFCLIHQTEHAFGGVGDQHGFFDLCHGGGKDAVKLPHFKPNPNP